MVGFPRSRTARNVPIWLKLDGAFLMDEYLLASRADSPEIAKAALVVDQAAWSGLEFLNFTQASFDHYQALLDHYADHQICLIDARHKYVVAVGNCVPLYCEDMSQLPEDGWDWAVRTAYETRDRTPNILIGLAVSVPKVHQGKGLARRVIKAMGDLARSRGLAGPWIPVRPSAKHRFPDVSISDYVRWDNGNGAPFDPWLRSHVAMGATILGPCSRSMSVEEPVGFWESWTGRRFEQSGPVEIQGGLVPVDIDLENGVGRYVEPNVWVTYTTQ